MKWSIYVTLGLSLLETGDAATLAHIPTSQPHVTVPRGDKGIYTSGISRSLETR